MKLSKTEKELIEMMDGMEIIDCHEHLAPEKERTSSSPDVFTLFSHYTKRDLFMAGMKEADYNSLYKQEIPVETRWKTFAPFWRNIRYTSYSRAALITVRKFYGFDDINEKTCIPISKNVRDFNKPGIYKKILRDTCNIKTCLTQCGRTDLGSDLLTPLMPMILHDLETKEGLLHPSFEPEVEIKSLDDCISSLERYVLKVRKEGAVGLKMVSLPYSEPDREEAESSFQKISSGMTISPKGWPFFNRPSPLRSYLTDHAIRLAGENRMVVAVHTGYWGDFRDLHPLHIIPLLIKHPEVRFDVYHLGYPWVRDALMLCKGFENVWLNFCWTHVISQKFAMDGLDEAIDLVPVNKILGFGGDYHYTAVEKVYGHLSMAKEDISRVLARRMEEGRLNESDAEYMVKSWFWNNPVELYNLPFAKKQ